MRKDSQLGQGGFAGVTAWPLLLVSALGICAALALRLRFLDLPLERDEGVYAVIAQQIMAGLPPYESTHDMRFPGIYAVYALLLSIFGSTHTGLHGALLVTNAVSCALLYGLAQNLAGRAVGFSAAALFAVLSLGPAVQGLWANNEHFVLPPVLGGLWLLRVALERRDRLRLLGAGLLLGIAPTVKQHGLFFPAAAAVMVLAGSRRHPRSERVVDLCTLGLGIGIPSALIAAALAWAGVFDEFWFWTVRYAGQYASRIPLERGLGYLSIHGANLLREAWPAFALALLGIGALMWDRRWQRIRGFALGFIASSALCVVPGFYFRPHYFALLLPAASVSAALGIEAIANAAGRLHSAAFRWLAAGLLAAALGYPLFADRGFYALSPPDAARAVYFPNPFPEALEIGAFIREHTRPGETIAVIGSEPQIYFYAGRPPATAWIYTYPMMEPHPLALTMQQEMVAEIEAARPAFVVYVGSPLSWLVRPGSPQHILRWAASYTSRDYRRVGAVELISADRSVVLWGEEAANYRALSPNFLWVFERRGRAGSTAPSRAP